MTEYYTENFESYSEIFKEHAGCIAELMKILDDEIVSMGLPPAGRTEKLFRMVLDLLYHVDTAYEKKHNVKKADYKIATYMSEGDVIAAMRTALREELANQVGSTDGNK